MTITGGIRAGVVDVHAGRRRAHIERRLAAKVEREQSAITLTDLSVKILDYARDHGRVKTRDMVREHGASANTLKATFSSLVEKRLLVRHGGGRSTWYALQ
jgi:predicted HTH transcriptional regulator